MKRTATILLAGILLVSLLAACGSSAAPSSQAPASAAAGEEAPAAGDGSDITGTVNFWYSVVETDTNNPDTIWMSETLEMFKEQYPGITLQGTNTPDGNDYLTKITTEIAAGNTPDVFRTWMTGRLEPFVTSGKVAPLNDFVDARPELKETLNPIALEFATFGDSFYALPTLKSGEVIYYNKSLFEAQGLEAPKTFAELMETCAAFNTVDITPMALGAGDTWPSAMPYMYLFNRIYGNDLYEEVVLGKVAKFDDPAWADTGVKLQEMVAAGVFNPNVTAISYDDAKASFVSGKSAMIYEGVWALAELSDKMGDDLGFFNFPSIEGGKGSDNDWLINYDSGYAISSSCEYPEAAEALLAFLLSPERQARYAELGQLTASINLDVDTSQLAPVIVELGEALDKANYAIIPYDNPLGTTVGTEFNVTVQAILSGSDPTDAFENLNAYAADEWG